MKNYSKKLGFAILLLALIVINLSANKSNWAGADLSTAEIDNCVHFQLARGGTCVGEFDNLRPILDRFIKKNYNPIILKRILGNPNLEKNESGSQKLFYSLSADPNLYKLQIEIKNDQFTSYSLSGYN